MNHNHKSRMFFEDVVGEGNNHDNGSRWGVEREAGKAFDKRREKCSRKQSETSVSISV